MSPTWSLSGHDPAQALRVQGFALLAPAYLEALTKVPLSVMRSWEPSWDRLAPDEYLLDGGRYRSRRHGCFIQEIGSSQDIGGSLTLAPPRPHWQSTDYNALHGGIDRWFEPLEAPVVADAGWSTLLCSLGSVFAEADSQAAGPGPAAGPGIAASPNPAAGPTTAARPRVARWYIEAHQFRIDASSGVGRPTPEGAHRDGVDFVAVIVVNRRDIKGGETRVFEADGPLGMRFVIEAPWSALLLDDARMIHESTPIQATGPVPVRDTLVLTYRRGGFQAADAEPSA